MIAIYKITNQLNGKPYIEQTRQPIEKRFLQHSKAKTPLGNAMRQCGLENFTIEVVETCETQTHANERESFWIKVLKCTVPNGYNQRGGSHMKPKANSSSTSPTVGERIKQFRQLLKLSQTEFGKKLGIGQQSVANIENGINASASAKCFWRTAWILTLIKSDIELPPAARRAFVEFTQKLVAN